MKIICLRKKQTMEEKKKSFMDDAEGFLSSWKDDYAKKNKDILERKKKREETAKAEHEEFLKEWEEIKADLSGTAKDVYETFVKEFKGFTGALKDGTATVAEKIQLEKRFDQLKFFFKKAGDKGAEQFDKISESVKEQFNKFDKELPSEREGSVEDIKNQAEELLTDKNLEDLNEIDENHQKIKDLFGDLD